MKRWTHRPEGSNWGDFGDDDQLGSLNLIGPAEVRAAAAEIREGLRFGLSLPLDYPGGSVLAPHRQPPRLHSSQRRGKPFFNYGFSQESAAFCDFACDDAVTLSTQYSTQWDGLAHIGFAFDADGDGVAEACYYNGYRAGTHILPPELRERDARMPLGIDAFAERPIQGRGVLVDLAHHFGRARQAIGWEQMSHAMARDGIEVQRGDVLCIHTGFAAELLKMQRQPDAQKVHSICAVLDGCDAKLLQWISDSGVAAIAADNYAVEAVTPPGDPAADKMVPLHHHCLFKRGIPLGELWHLSELAAWLRLHGRHRFFLSAPPLRLPGAVGSPVTPVATV